jgi:hypothetical protein
MIKITTSRLQSGMILHVRSYTTFGRLIRKALNVKKPSPRCWGNHDGIIIESNGQFYSGDSEPFVAKLTPISHYERNINLGKCECKIYRLKDTSRPALGQQAATYWIDNVCSTPYDFIAFIRLFIKATVGDLSNSKYGFLRRLGEKSAGLTWANWCTEGVAESFDKVTGGMIYGKTNPTPYITEKRVGIVFDDITDSVIVKTC